MGGWLVLNFDDDDDNKTSGWNQFWNREFHGSPLWYIAAMGALPLYLGLLVEALGYGDAALLTALVVLIAGGVYFAGKSLCRDRRS